MLKGLSFTDFMGVGVDSEDYILFYDKTVRSEPVRFLQITGGKGAGKTRIVEAACFALTGFDTSGVSQPTHLISEGQRDASVGIKFGSYHLQRKLSRVSKYDAVVLKCKGTTVAVDDEGIASVLGLSPHAVASSCIAGYFGRLASAKKRAVYNEIFCRKVPNFGAKFEVQKSYNFRIRDSYCHSYQEMSMQSRRMFDLRMCYEIQKNVASRLGFVFFDDADTFIWDDATCPPRGIQIIFTKSVSCAPLEIRGGV
jgi:hypothetical protein